MATATLTKAEILAQLEAAQARVSELEAAQAPEERRDQLVQRVWLQRQAPSNVEGRPAVRGYTREGDLWLTFGAQYASRDTQSGQRYYGAFKNLVAFGDIAEAAQAIFESGDRLVEIRAYERPVRHDGPGARRSEWVLTSIQPLRTAPAQAPEAPAEQPVEPAGYPEEPSSEEVPF